MSPSNKKSQLFSPAPFFFTSLSLLFNFWRQRNLQSNVKCRFSHGSSLSRRTRLFDSGKKNITFPSLACEFISLSSWEGLKITKRNEVLEPTTQKTRDDDDDDDTAALESQFLPHEWIFVWHNFSFKAAATVDVPFNVHSHCSSAMFGGKEKMTQQSRRWRRSTHPRYF